MALQKSQIGTHKNQNIELKRRALEDGKESFFMIKC